MAQKSVVVIKILDSDFPMFITILATYLTFQIPFLSGFRFALENLENKRIFFSDREKSANFKTLAES